MGTRWGVIDPRADDEQRLRFLLRFTSGPSQETRARLELRRVRRDVVRQVRQDAPRLLVFAAIAFVIGFLVNFYFMRTRYGGFNVPPQSPTTGEGSRLIGSLFWIVLSGIAFAFVGLARKRGRQRVLADLLGAPKRIRDLVVHDREQAVIHAAYGFAGAMLVVVLVGPALAGIVSLGFLLFLGTAFRRLAMGVVMVVWRWAVGLVAPQRATPANRTVTTVAMVGGFAATLVGRVVPGTTGRALLVVVAVVGATTLARRNGESTPTSAVLLVAGAGSLWVLAGGDPVAFADDGGSAECAGAIRGCAGVGHLAELAALGGAAAAAGAAAGEAVGEGLGEEGEGAGSGPGEDDDELAEPERFPCGDDEAEAEISAYEQWQRRHPRGSWDQFMAERIEQSRQQAQAKSAEVDRLHREVQRLEAQADKMLAEFKGALEPTKPWRQLSAKEKQFARAAMTKTWRQANPSGDPAEFMAYLQRLDADPSLTTLDMFQYIAGESLLGLPGAVLDAGGKSIRDMAGNVLNAKEFTGNLIASYVEDLQTGEQADRLGRTFIDPIGNFWDDVWDKGPQAVAADMRSQGVKVTQAGVAQLDSAMQQLHLAMITGDGKGIAKVMDSAAGSMISDYVLGLGAAKVTGIAKRGVSLLRGRGVSDDLVAGAETVLTGADEIPLDTPAKRASVGFSENATKGFQDATDAHGNRLQMQRRGADAVQHEGKAYMKPQGGKSAKSVGRLDKHLGGPDEEGLLAFYEPQNPLAAPGSPLQKRYELVKTLYDGVPGATLAEKQRYLTKSRLEVWVNGEKVKIPIAFDKKGVMRHAQTGRPITSDYDGWAVLDENGRRLGYTEDGQRLLGAQKQADRQRKIPMIRDLVDDPRTNLQHAPTSSEWGPVPALLAGDIKGAAAKFKCDINKIGESIIEGVGKEGVVEFRPGAAHPFLTKPAGVKGAKSPTLKVKGAPTRAARKGSLLGDLAHSAVQDQVKGAAKKATDPNRGKAPARPAKSPAPRKSK